MDGFRKALLPGLPVERIRSAYAAAPGKEIESGKFGHPESSAALVANAFGIFLGSPADLPPLPGTEPYGWPASSVALEATVRFPWDRGRHPCLDVLIETSSALIGVESKRFEPFRSKSEAELSNAYWRPVWGERTKGYERVRDLLHHAPGRFEHLDAAQLIKHAFALRTAAHGRGEMRPVLFYLYAEPASNPRGTRVRTSAIEQHRAEIADFAACVADDEVHFYTASYAELLSFWSKSASAAIQRHAAALDERFFGLFQGVSRVWCERMNDNESGMAHLREVCTEIFTIIDENWKAGRHARDKLPSRENWRWAFPACTLSERNTSAEVTLERTFIRACEARRSATTEPPAEHIWSNQIPVASGVRSAFDRRRTIDLVYRRGPKAFDFIELKIGSDDPICAARQIIEYGLLWLVSRRERAECAYHGALIDADDIRLCVLAPAAFYPERGVARLADELSAGLQEIAAPLGANLSFCFQQFPAFYSRNHAFGDEELIQLFEKRETLR